MVDKLVADTRWFFQSVTDYSSGFLCYLCSPTARNYFQFVKGSFIIRQNPTTFHHVFGWYRYSLSTIRFVNSSVFPMTEFARCIANKFEDPHFALYTVDDPGFLGTKTEIKVCSGDLKVTDRRCYKKCSVNFRNIDVKLNFIRHYSKCYRWRKSGKNPEKQ